MLVLPFVFGRAGGFTQRVTVEARDDQRDGRARFRMVSAGEPIPGDVRLAYPEDERGSTNRSDEIPDFASVRRAFFKPRVDDSHGPSEVKVWAHRVTPGRLGSCRGVLSRARAREKSASATAGVEGCATSFV
jgi:hypothetical protein